MDDAEKFKHAVNLIMILGGLLANVITSACINTDEYFQKKKEFTGRIHCNS